MITAPVLLLRLVTAERVFRIAEIEISVENVKPENTDLHRFSCFQKHEIARKKMAEMEHVLKKIRNRKHSIIENRNIELFFLDKNFFVHMYDDLD